METRSETLVSTRFHLFGAPARLARPMLSFSSEEGSSHGHHHHGHPLSPSGIPAGISTRSRGFLHAFASRASRGPYHSYPTRPLSPSSVERLFTLLRRREFAR